LGIVGLVPLFVLLAALLGRRRLAIAAVPVAAPVYLICALLLDAASTDGTTDAHSLFRYLT